MYFSIQLSFLLYCFSLYFKLVFPATFSFSPKLLYFRHQRLVFWLNLDLSHSLGWTNDWDILCPWSHSIFHSHSHTDTQILPLLSHFSFFLFICLILIFFSTPSPFCYNSLGRTTKILKDSFSSTYFIPSGSGICSKSLPVLLLRIGCNLLSIFLFSFPTLIPWSRWCSKS